MDYLNERETICLPRAEKRARERMRAQDSSVSDSEERSSLDEQLKTEEERIQETGQVLLIDNRRKNRIHLLSVIGEIEGHENLSSNTKTTKYEHILPKLAEIGG